VLLLVSPVLGSAQETPSVDSPALTVVPELRVGFDLLYEQKFAEAREAFVSWKSRNPGQPFGDVAIAASYRFVLWFGGIQGDKRLGMEQVAKTAENGRYLKPLAKIILALAARREKQNALAQKLLRELNEQYPDNELFASEYAKASGLSVPATMVR
jgi:hypothetical protein